MKKKEDIIFLGIIILIMVGGLIKPFIKPIDIVYIENRPAQIMPEFTMEKFINKTYQDDIEKAFSDQIPLSGRMKLFEKGLSFLAQQSFYKLLNSNSYYQLSPSVYMYKNYLVYMTYNFSEIKTELDNKIDNYNKALKNLKDVKKYLYYIEKDTDIDFITNKKLNAYEYLVNNLNKDIVSDKFSINNYQEFSNYFYQTDHHWNYKGSYKGYTDLVKMLTNDEPIIFSSEKCTRSKVYGSKSANIGSSNLFDEYMCAYTFDLKDHDIYIDNKKVDSYGNSEYVLNVEPEITSYGDFYGWDEFLLIEFDYHNVEKENLLIIGESYDNAITELLASHFNKTYNVDLRNYKEITFDINDFIKKNNIKNVLLIGNVDFYRLSDFNLKVGE